MACCGKPKEEKKPCCDEEKKDSSCGGKKRKTNNSGQLLGRGAPGFSSNQDGSRNIMAAVLVFPGGLKYNVRELKTGGDTFVPGKNERFRRLFRL